MVLTLPANHLGSTVGTVSDTGVTEHVEYYPYGGAREGRVSTDRGFTGQRREGFLRLGAYFYHARFYATGLGHFLSADTSSTDGLDRYAYVRFNPLRYTDPSGHGIPLGGGLSEGFCPSTHSDCANDGSGPVGGDGGGGGGERGDGCDQRCQWITAWDAFHPAPSGSDNGGGAPTASQTPVPDTARAGPLPEVCGSICASVDVHPNSEARRRGACLLCPLAPVAVAGRDFLTNECVQATVNVTALVVGGAVVITVVGPEVLAIGSLFAANALIDTQVAFAVAGNAAVAYSVAKYGGPSAQPGVLRAFAGPRQFWSCIN